MAPHVSAYRLTFIALLLLFVLFILRLAVGYRSSGVTDVSAKSAKPKGPVRPLKPRTPGDSPQCMDARQLAMKAEVTDRCWTEVELLSYPIWPDSLRPAAKVR